MRPLSPVSVRDAAEILDDRRVKNIRPLIPPQILVEEIPLTLRGAQTVIDGRKQIENIIKGDDDRLLVIVGPCSVHNVEQALIYARELKKYADTVDDDLMIVMRVYFEKPRTTVGWKGLINDPDMNGSYQINRGLKTARKLLLDIAEMGLPTAGEFLDVISPQFLADLSSWGAIGARTTESQVHRELTSALSMSVGFKNGTDGSIDIAVDAIKAAAAGHTFLSVTKQGLTAIVETSGNPSTHVILRGSTKGPNFSAEHVSAAAEKLKKAGLVPRLMVDCSHGNSSKQHIKQLEVGKDIAEQLANGPTAQQLLGVMIESNINEGRQNIPPEGPSGLLYGVSITDACISLEQTFPLLNELAAGVRARRENVKARLSRA
ncbi:Phospho-2-dehydro-3-deoxyheptonate aldolase, tyrosine-inhibited [Vanrija pseudolonga]|uniref:Phospho-2-dehydro-3-deoxyheptonate aldolase n=1 Tax=Vanrija pseudolonga TaxID=143232 RepID=A0AAF1BQI8_9TREE|nr:Phospho-2-dehydro-3-deoxyheptonate aldolase, tyrosine-inhibited [Vanrija pseudolonga]